MVIANAFDNVGYVTCVVSIMLQCFYTIGRMWRLLICSVLRRQSVYGHLNVIGSRPSDHYFRSVCLFVCLSV